MQTNTNRARMGRFSSSLVAAAASFAVALTIAMVSPGKASGDGPVLVSAVSGVLSRTNYQSLVAGADGYGYWGEQAAAPDRIQYVADTAGQRGIVQRIELQPGDKSGAGERAEVINPAGLGGFQDGQTIVMSWGLLIDSTFASPPGAWNYFVQIHADGGGNQAPLYLALAGDQADLVLGMVGGGNWIPEGQPANTVRHSLDLGPISKNRWHDFVMKTQFGCAGEGYVQLWVDGELVADVRDQKIGYCGDPGMYWKQGFYRSAYDKTTRLWFSDTVRWASLQEAAKYYGLKLLDG